MKDFAFQGALGPMGALGPLGKKGATTFPTWQPGQTKAFLKSTKSLWHM